MIVFEVAENMEKTVNESMKRKGTELSEGSEIFQAMTCLYNHLYWSVLILRKLKIAYDL